MAYKRKTSKEKSDSDNLELKEPEAVYYTSPKNSQWNVYRGGGSASLPNNYIERSITLLGMETVKPFDEVKNVNDFIDCIREGVPKKALDNLIDIAGITTGEIANIIRTSDRTLRRYTAKQKLNPEQSERIIELAKLYSRGEEVFGNLDAFKEWMSTIIIALGSKKPKEFLDTSLGIDMLMNELGRIEQGIFA